MVNIDIERLSKDEKLINELQEMINELKRKRFFKKYVENKSLKLIDDGFEIYDILLEKNILK